MAPAGGAVAGLRPRGQHRGRNRPAALLAPSVPAGCDPVERGFDLGQRLPLGHGLPGQHPRSPGLGDAYPALTR